MMDTALRDRTDVNLEDGTRIISTHGKVGCIVISGVFGKIDLSQDPTGELAAGRIEPTLYPGHDDERDSVIGATRFFPETEEDFALASRIAVDITAMEA